MKDGKAFENVRHNVLHTNFPNGNSISTIWGHGTYSENYNFDMAGDPVATFQTFLGSDTVEIMPSCSPELLKQIQDKYNEGSDSSVIGYLTMTQWLEIMNLVANEKVQTPNA